LVALSIAGAPDAPEAAIVDPGASAMKPSPHSPAPQDDADPAKRTGRRRLVVGAGVAAGAAVAAAALQRRPESDATVAPTSGPADSHEGYRLTEHVRRYYESTRT
jgi:hypothetical protein